MASARLMPSSACNGAPGLRSSAPSQQQGWRRLRLAPRVVTVGAIRNPYKLLNLSDGASLKDVKTAFRKLALQHHPDVSKEEDAQAHFIALTSAYELLMGRSGGKEGTDHSDSNGWNFHDWYWSFRASRSWGTQQAGGSSKKAKTPGYQEPESKEVLECQLAGLRHRAAVRKTQAQRAPCASSLLELGCGPEDCTAASGVSLDQQEGRAARAAPEQQHAPQQQPQGHSVVDGQLATVLGNAVPFPGFAFASLSSSPSSQPRPAPLPSPEAAPQGSFGAPPVPAAQQQQLLHGAQAGQELQQQQQAAEEKQARQERWQQSSRRPFVASSDSKKGVSEQLAGLRRKASLRSPTSASV